MGFQSYSEDLKLLATRMAIDGVSLDEINVTLRTSISPASLWRWKQLLIHTNRVVHDPMDYQRRGRPHVLSDDQLEVLKELVIHSPSVYLDELQRRMFAITGESISRSTLSRELHERLGLSHLVTRGVHPGQSEDDRADYMIRVAGIPPEYMVFIDESGIKGIDCLRTRSWAPTGSCTVRQTQETEQEHWTILPAVCERGMIAAAVHEGPVSRVHVELFLERELLPVMNPYPGINSVLVLDNARIHHGGVIEQLCREAGVLLVYLPAYSPDLNPIENAFFVTKMNLKRNQGFFEAEDKGDYILLLAARVMTRSLLQPLISHCGYTTSYYWDRYNQKFV